MPVESVSLSIVAVVLFALASLRARRYPSALPGAAMAAVLLIITFVAPSLWAWSKESGGAGLPSDITTYEFAVSPAPPALLWAAIGAAAAAFFVPHHDRSDYRSITISLRSERTAQIVLALSIVFICLWLLGQGPSVVSRNEYLLTDGNMLLLRVSTLPGPLLAVFTLWIGSRTKSELLKPLLFAAAGVWYVLLVSIGTRTAVAIPLLASVLAFHAVVSGGGRGIHRRLRFRFALLGAVFLFASVVTITITLYARSVPHGLLRLPDLVTFALSPPDGFWTQSDSSVKMLVASIAASYPILERSVAVPVGLDVLLSNANPLPGTGLEYQLERYQPFEWVPLAMTGEWYQAVGPVGQFALFFATGWVCGSITHNLLRSRFNMLSMAGTGLALMIAVLSVQYSSRMVWRFAWIALAIALVTYLIRQRRAKQASPEPEPSPGVAPNQTSPESTARPDWTPHTGTAAGHSGSVLPYSRPG